MIRPTIVHLSGWIALATSLTTFSGCGNDQSHGGAKPEEAAIKVIVATPIEQDVTEFMDYTGRTEAVESVDIRSRVSGYLTKVEYMGSLDSEVKAGDLLFQIDERPYLNTLATAEARLASAQARLTVSAAELERTEGLFKKGVSVKSDLDRDVGRKAQADADILEAQASISQAKLDLEFTHITAPIGGMISKPNLTVGNLVSPATQSLTTVVSVDPIYVYFDLDELTMLQIQQNIREGKLATREEGQYKVMLGLSNNPGHPYSGLLDFIDNRVNPNTGTIRVRGIFKNEKPERGSRPLSPGLFARVRVPLGKPRPSLLVTERAVVRVQGQPYLYLVGGDNVVTRRKIRLGPMHEGMRVVLADAAAAPIKASDQIVIGGLQRIREGAAVAPVVKTMPGGEATTGGDK